MPSVCPADGMGIPFLFTGSYSQSASTKGSTFNSHAQDPALIGCSFRGLNEYPFLSTNP
jgi:hypothetical protein